MFVDKYKTWVEKIVKNLRCSKGAESKALLARFQRLELREDELGAFHHVRTLHKLAREYAQERKNLRWLGRLVERLGKWEKLFESILRITEIDEDSVVEALAKDEIDEEFAIGLMQ